jgi:MFS-type transporter involved in bile tolerance (Atg22 family)
MSEKSSGPGGSGDKSSCDGNENNTRIQTAQNTSEALTSTSTHKERNSPLVPEANEEICIGDSLSPDVQGKNERSSKTEVNEESLIRDSLSPDAPRENKPSSKTEIDHPASVEIPTETAPPYTVFSKGQVRFIIAMAAFAGSISPLSATIYFPALNVLARDLHVSSADINLTLTTYMILQGISPTLFCDLADNLGRRPVIIAGFIIYIGACLGLALQESFPLLLFLRCLQSAGTSSTVAISVSIAADVSTQSERGVYMGWVTSGTAVGTAVGPIIGGLLSHYLGWQSIFWFLAIVVSVYMVPLVLSFPETARNVVGNGSTRPQSRLK